MQPADDLRREVSYCPWLAMLRPVRGLQQPAVMLMLILLLLLLLAPKEGRLRVPHPRAGDSEGPCHEWQRQRFIHLWPTWRMAERERPIFLVRHREWDNMVAV